jgi:hypothetical protein
VFPKVAIAVGLKSCGEQIPEGRASGMRRAVVAAVLTSAVVGLALVSTALQPSRQTIGALPPGGEVTLRQ